MAQNEDEDPICDAELEMHHQAKRTTSKKKGLCLPVMWHKVRYPTDKIYKSQWIGCDHDECDTWQHFL
jgi:hypothetical protein